MSRIFTAGLINMETTLNIHSFPVEYSPIEYSFFGIESAVSGVAYNIVCALNALGDEVKLASLTGNDDTADIITNSLDSMNADTSYIRRELDKTPQSIVAYDDNGKRKIYCDLKDIQDRSYEADTSITECIKNSDIAVLCNINFTRSLIHIAKENNISIATDVHVLSDINDEYNSEYMQAADILFLSDENAPGDRLEFIEDIAKRYDNKIIVMGCGKDGAALYDKEQSILEYMPAADIGGIVNTVGAGDALFSAFIHYYAKGVSSREALKRAQLFAACKIRVNGAAKGMVTEKEIDDIYE